ncbi:MULTISPECIES: ABC transporter substrate-binding protein [Mycobacteriaceae]|nr:MULTISPECIES: ABC transporter substrate-binding protein [Mycobacteriaceae]AHC27631.2 peptide ABC transporter substrate-binding protein [Mycolicibacterium neoaurum VKM Ac-1815D]AMO07815.1 peptide ABC transporter substrate-binding protein [Mycolicibacterium neoaurum]AXK73780.1 peptide ABC transporter substrate-binding protein [Mycolicibacterium neoaurum]KJQ49647.1 peptide ABC transporter substrate-binding protein [Mycolicibacterium neoaurum]KUM07143.1 peptide ABC transporter substrate-binding
MAATRMAPRLLVIAGTAVLAAGCTVANSGGGGYDPDTLRIVLQQEPPTLEPCESSLTSTGIVVRSNITEPLLERDATTGDLQPLLATEWEQTSPTEWTFRLRDGVTFSDGAPFTSEDAAFSIDRAVNSDLQCNVDGYVFGDESLALRTPDAETVVIGTTEPDPILPLRISFVEMVPRTTSVDEKVREPIGTGPYAIERWEYGQKLTLTRNPTYWGAAPAFGKAEYRWRSEGSVRAAMITNDEADIAVGLGPEDGAGDLGVPFQNNETTALRMQATEPPLDDIRVRQAINYAVNRTGIVKALFRDLGEPAAQLIPSGVVGYNEELPLWPHDLDKAKELIAQAKADGVPVDRQIRLIGRTAQFPKITETIEVLQSEFTEIGLNVKIEMMDTASQLQYQLRPFPANTGPYLLMIMHGNQAGDAAFTLDQYMLSDGPQAAYGTPEFDAKIRAAEALTGQARQDAFAELFAEEPQEIMQMAYLAHMKGILGKSSRVDYTPDPATGDEMRLAAMTPAAGDRADQS